MKCRFSFSFNAVVFLFFLHLAVAPSFSAAPLVIETYGDSLTAGFLSHTNITHPPPLSEVSRIISDLFMFAVTKNYSYLKKHHRYDLAWPEVLGEHFSKHFGETVVSNHALSGDKSVDLIKQVNQGIQLQMPAQAFYFIGHNDLCGNMSSPEDISGQFFDHMDGALRIWDQNHKDSRAHLVSVGAIHKVYRLLLDFTWYKGNETNQNYRCIDSWEKFFPFCPFYAKMARAGKLTDHLAPRIKAMNQKLQDLATFRTISSANGNIFQFVELPEKPELKHEHFAIDCYHLSAEGQKYLADSIFSSIY